MKRYSLGRIFLVVGLMVMVSVMIVKMTNVADARRPEALAVQVNTGSGFSFQGYLDDQGVPVNGTCRFTFGLFDRAQGGNLIGAPQEIRDVDVIDGNFAVVLNEGNQFGDNAFNGQARWLGIRLDCGRGETMLSTRQELLAVPYAFSLRPGATISGNTPADTGILNLSGGDYGLRVLSAESDGIQVDEAGGDGVRVISAADDGIQTWAADYGGIFSGHTAGVLAQGRTDLGPDIILSGIAGELHLDGRIATDPQYSDSYMTLESNASVNVLLDADDSNPDGGPGSHFVVNNSGYPELVVDSSGVRGRRFFVPSNNIPGVYFEADTGGVYARTNTDSGPDLVLGGTDGDTLTGDDGIISSETGPGFESSDIVLSSNDTVRIDLNANGDDQDVGSLEVYDDDGNLLFIVDTNGNVCIGNCPP